jgi:S-adenosyl methyltransferase
MLTRTTGAARPDAITPDVMARRSAPRRLSASRTSMSQMDSAQTWTADVPTLADPFTTAHIARVDNVLLGGSYHWAVDRRLAAHLTTAVSDVTGMVWHNRMFQRRAVEYLLATGIRQFIELGCGIPTIGATHEIAHRRHPDVKVAYVDNDPITVELGRILLADRPRAVIVHADLREPHYVLGHPEVNDLLDLGQPVAILALAVLHHILDDEVLADVIAALRDWTVSGSHLAVSHLCNDRQLGPMRTLAQTLTDAGIATAPRSSVQIGRLFRGWDLLPPGLTWTANWRPEPDVYPDLSAEPHWAGLLTGLARKTSTESQVG